MFNLYSLIKCGGSLDDIKTGMRLLSLIVVELNEPMCNYDIEKVFDEIKEAIAKDTDNDFEESYFLTTVNDLDKYFYDKISEVKEVLDKLEVDRYDMVQGASGEIRSRSVKQNKEKP